MPLFKYEVDFSQLSVSEKTELTNQIKMFAFNGLHLSSDLKTAVFYIENKDDLKFISKQYANHIFAR